MSTETNHEIAQSNRAIVAECIENGVNGILSHELTMRQMALLTEDERSRQRARIRKQVTAEVRKHYKKIMDKETSDKLKSWGL